MAAGPTALATGDLNDFPIAVSATVADTIFTATDNIFLIETATQNITRVTLICIAADAEELTVA